MDSYCSVVLSVHSHMKLNIIKGEVKMENKIEKHQHKDVVVTRNNNGELVVTSRQVAEDFEKRHSDVLDKISGLIREIELTENSARYFINSFYVDAKGEKRKEFLLTRDGFSLLVMGFTGSKALQWKLKYIEAFNKMEQAIKGQAKRLSTEEMLELQFRYAKEVKEEVKELRDDFTEYKETTPLFTVECKELQALVRKKGVEVLGGKGSQAYIDNSLRGKVYADIQHQLKREFQVTKYEAIKRGQFLTAKEIVANYRVPTGLKEEIIKVNNQIDFKNAI